eukprot:4636444-Prymnesium_polylepis.1
MIRSTARPMLSPRSNVAAASSAPLEDGPSREQVERAQKYAADLRTTVEAARNTATDADSRLKLLSRRKAAQALGQITQKDIEEFRLLKLLRVPAPVVEWVICAVCTLLELPSLVVSAAVPRAASGRRAPREQPCRARPHPRTPAPTPLSPAGPNDDDDAAVPGARPPRAAQDPSQCKVQLSWNQARLLLGRADLLDSLSSFDAQTLLQAPELQRVLRSRMEGFASDARVPGRAKLLAAARQVQDNVRRPSQMPSAAGEMLNASSAKRGGPVVGALYIWLEHTLRNAEWLQKI